jgi:hypothetical protein
MNAQPPVRVGDVVHHTAITQHADGTITTAPCRAAFVTSLPHHLRREPYDGCSNGYEGEWVADLLIFGSHAHDFRERVDWASSPTVRRFPEEAVHDGLWHTATECGED